MSDDRKPFPVSSTTTSPVRWVSSERMIDWPRAQVGQHRVSRVHDVTHLIELAHAGARSEGHDPGPVIAALPFDVHSAHAPPVVVAHGGGVESARGAAGASPRIMSATHRPAPAVRFVGSTPSAREYGAGVRRLRALIDDGAVDKVVLARRFDYDATGHIDVDTVFERLGERHPAALRFSVPVPLPRGWERFVGASPELLVSRRGSRVRSHPLAGSARRSSDLVADERAARALLASDKDAREHAFVVEAIADILAPHCRSLVVPAAPSLVATATAWHLGTWIEGELRDPDTSCALLAAQLHPTPAVCGTPTGAARALIGELEGDRGYYAGAVGWADVDGDGEWAVAIRSAVIGDRHVSAYAGAGIVAGSVPRVEIAETQTKVRAVLGAFDVVDAGAHVTPELSA